MGYTDKHYTEVRKAQQKAYAPYSQFKVGAYLVT
ncbi:cytidine deaminase, partial [Staphylococcus pseudintermedius]|nr:cytidine deaminase [Staphylococcus pseudintermedius]